MNPIESLKAVNQFDPSQARSDLYPQAVSPRSLSVRFTPAKVDRDHLYLAQQYARFAECCKTADKRQVYFNKANYFLAGAFLGHTSNEAFTEQFWIK